MAAIGVFYFSKSGNTRAMAEAVAEGGREAGVEVLLVEAEQVDPRTWRDLDAIIIGSPTYFGNMCWQMKKLVDDSIVVYRRLKGKVGGVFTSSGSRRDGEHALQALTWALEIHGMSVEPGVLCEGEPDDNALRACRDYGMRVAQAASGKAA